MPPLEPLPYLLAQDIPLDVLFEDSHLIVLNKPTGLTVHPAPDKKGGTLVNALLHHCPDLPGIGGEMRPGIVHRLDKDTTVASLGPRARRLWSACKHRSSSESLPANTWRSSMASHPAAPVRFLCTAPT
jgi:hypothetical protein